MSHKEKEERLRFFNEAVEYIDKFDNKELVINRDKIPLNSLSSNASFLRDEMINELNNLREIIRNNPDLKIKALTDKEREVFYNFIDFYRICPICGNQNHFFNLKQIFFDEDKKIIIEKLIRLMTLNREKLQRNNFHLGVPCCNCYKEFFIER
ncbi:MAG: hypothetical protein ACFFDF_07540 [Candidatus Odinarchaeota archaeon]